MFISKSKNRALVEYFSSLHIYQTLRKRISWHTLPVRNVLFIDMLLSYFSCISTPDIYRITFYILCNPEYLIKQQILSELTKPINALEENSNYILTPYVSLIKPNFEKLYLRKMAYFVKICLQVRLTLCSILNYVNTHVRNM